MLEADVDQLLQLRMHDDQVHPEPPRGQRLGRSNFRAKLVGRHGAAGEDAEPARVGDGRDQGALRHPCHGTAHQG
jgi:hypothetical protein